MISQHSEGMTSTFLPVSPFFKSQLYGEEFTVTDFIIGFRRVKLVGEIGTWVKVGWDAAGIGQLQLLSTKHRPQPRKFFLDLGELKLVLYKKHS